MSDHPPARGRSNQDRVLALLTRAGQASRGELASELRLPKATVADLVARLISQGLIAPVQVPAGRGHQDRDRSGRDQPGRGRPGQVLTLTGPAPAIAVITWTSGQLRCSVAALSGQVRAEGVVVPE